MGLGKFDYQAAMHGFPVCTKLGVLVEWVSYSEFGRHMTFVMLPEDPPPQKFIKVDLYSGKAASNSDLKFDLFMYLPPVGEIRDSVTSFDFNKAVAGWDVITRDGNRAQVCNVTAANMRVQIFKATGTTENVRPKHGRIAVQDHPEDLFLLRQFGVS